MTEHILIQFIPFTGFYTTLSSISMVQQLTFHLRKLGDETQGENRHESGTIHMSF